MRDRVDHPEIGTNARMDEMTAAFLSAKLRRLSAWNLCRLGTACQYFERIGSLLEMRMEQGSCFHLFVVQSDQRDALQEHLAKAGVQTAIHYPVPPHLSGAYAGKISGEFPITEQLAKTALSLPISPFHTGEEIGRVIAAVRSFFER